MSTPAIALYLGETYATIGLFDINLKTGDSLIFEKSVFLPQSSLKSLLNQTKTKIEEIFVGNQDPVKIFIVTKYFDRLKQFRLGGSISQVISKGFENSYSLNDSKSLSLAAAQLIITVDPEKISETQLQTELERVKKINPDLNKVVISLDENLFSSEKIEMLVQFFTQAGLKIFLCKQAHNQNELRKTLLNAGSDGTREELSKDLKESFGDNSDIYYFCQNSFQKDFDTAELFNSANNFFAQYLKVNQLTHCAYFDIESFKFLRNNLNTHWNSPWGNVPLSHYEQSDLCVHPFSELKLNHLSMLSFESPVLQLEPGPVIAGRAIKPLVLDLFWNNLQNNEHCKALFSTLTQENLKAKVSNIFSVLEKGQKNNLLFTTTEDLKKVIINLLLNEIKLLANGEKCQIIGPLSDLFSNNFESKNNNSENKASVPFTWPNEIIKIAHRENLCTV